jgi:hypothetical protein
MPPPVEVGQSDLNKNVHKRKLNTEESTITSKMSKTEEEIQFKAQHKLVILEPTNKNIDEPILPIEIGKILTDERIGINEIKKAGRFRYKVLTKTMNDASNLLQSTTIKSRGYEAYVPRNLLESVVVIREIPKKMTNDEIMLVAEAENGIEIMKAERMMVIDKNDNSKLKPTFSVKITVRGKNEPSFIKIYGYSCKTETYVYPLRMCNKCYRFGHKMTACKAKEQKCYKCGSTEHVADQCDAHPTCLNCKGTHVVTDRGCPERIRQNLILNDMTINRVTFHESAQNYPRYQKTPKITSLEEFPALKTTGTIPNFHKSNIQYTKADYKNAIQEMKKRKVTHTRTQIVKNVFPQPEQVPEPAHIFLPNPHRTDNVQREKAMSSRQITNLIENLISKLSNLISNPQVNPNQLIDTLETNIKAITHSPWN